MEEVKLPKLAYNRITFVGASIAAVSLVIIAFLIGLNIISGIENPYIGIILYIFLPPFLFFGLFLIPLGMYFQWRKWKRTGEIPPQRWPVIDLNKSGIRNASIIFIFGTMLLLVVSSYVTYEAYHFSESVTFCGTICHTVMKPEHTTYQSSPHARVACTSCHVGPGAGWYTKSKLSGAYQVYAVLVNNYPRPIPTPIENLRPAQETCEQCHWPKQFFGAQQRRFHHYTYDKDNSHWPINMLIKTGGGDPRTGQTSGIHWHMNINFDVEYIPRDQQRQDIPWVKITDRTTGRTTTYQDAENPLSEEEIASAMPRRMDCMDCHNRPSHVYHSPDYAIDQALLTGRISRTIPEIKRVTVEAINREYPAESEASKEIANHVTEFYRSNYAQYYAANFTLIDQAILSTQEIFQRNIFPEMKARWADYPDNIGHFIYKGCMRCHQGNHKSDEGLTITHDCTACHTILSQGTGELAEMSESPEGLEFKHPEDIGDAWKEIGCFDCHSGVQP